MKAMRLAGVSDKTLDRFAFCGSHCHVWESAKLQKCMIAGDFCRNRNCAPCAVARARSIQANLVPFIRDRRVRFLTLTLRHTTRPLSTQITRIWRSLKTLRSTPEWQANVRGFCAFLEIKRNPAMHQWHVHLHILCEGQFWEQKEISRLWLEATGDSMIVDIQAKGTPEGMANYAAKYASKPISAGDMETPLVHAEAIVALQHRRLWLIGGIWKGHLKLLAKTEDPGDWQLVCSANALFSAAASGNPQAANIVQNLLNGTPLDEQLEIDTS